MPELLSRMRKALRTNRFAGTYPSLTPTSVPMFRRDTCGRYRHTLISHTVAHTLNRRREIVQIWNSRKFLLSLCNDWWHSIPDATRSTLQPGLERCSPMDAMPDIQAMTRRKRYPYQKTELRIRNHYEKPAARCGTNRNGSIR